MITRVGRSSSGQLSTWDICTLPKLCIWLIISFTAALSSSGSLSFDILSCHDFSHESLDHVASVDLD